MLTGAGDISYEVITLSTYFSTFFLYSHSFTLRTDSQKSDNSNIFQEICQIPRFDLDLSLKKAT